MNARGRFITVEGIEGVGKSTNLDYLTEILRSHGKDVLCTREPGGTAAAERIRDLLLEHGDEPIPEVAELLLFFAARSLNIDNLIRPALERGEWVLCDRFTDATRAYQGGGRGIDRELIEALAERVHEGLQPDLTLLLDAPVDVGMQRATRRGAADRMETEQTSFYERVRATYLDLAAAHPERMRIIDAAAGIDDVQREIRQAVAPLLSDK